MTDPVRILLVDDDEDDFLLTREMIREADGPFVMKWASSYGAGAREIEDGRYDVYLIDYRLGQRDGLDLVRSAVSKGCQAPLIMLTGGAGDRRPGCRCRRVYPETVFHCTFC